MLTKDFSDLSFDDQLDELYRETHLEEIDQMEKNLEPFYQLLKQKNIKLSNLAFLELAEVKAFLKENNVQTLETLRILVYWEKIQKLNESIKNQQGHLSFPSGSKRKHEDDSDGGLCVTGSDDGFHYQDTASNRNVVTPAQIEEENKWLYKINELFKQQIVLKKIGDCDKESEHEWLGGIMIRDCYEAMRTKVICDNTFHWIILGNPGIGKSMWGLYLLYYLQKKGISFIYQPFNPDFKIYLHYDATKQELNICRHPKSNLVEYYIVDGQPYSLLTKKIILISSPRRNIYRSLQNNSDLVRNIFSKEAYMPIWNTEEILECNDYRYHLKHETIKNALDVFGPIPRYILDTISGYVKNGESEDKALEDEKSSLLTNELNKQTSSTWDLFLADQTDEAKASYKLVHIIVDKDFKQQGLTYASKYVLDKLLDRFLIKQIQDVKDEVLNKIGIGVRSCVRGVHFEDFAHRLFLKGDGAFEIKNLGKNSTDKLYPNWDQGKKFSGRIKHDEFNPRTYYQPSISNFAGIDSFVFEESTNNVMIFSLFQMTVAKEHSIILNKPMRDLILNKSADKEFKVRIYFVCLEGDNYEEFDKKQNIKMQNEVKRETKDAKNEELIKARQKHEKERFETIMAKTEQFSLKITREKIHGLKF